MIRSLFFICLFILFSVPIFAQSDSVVSRRSLFIIPHASYQQETSWAPGLAYGYYFKSKDISRISSVSGSAVYTFRNQFIFNVSPKLYFRANKWYLYSNINIRNYPDYYYGIGNNDYNLKQPYTSRNLSFLLQPQYEVINNLFVGLYISERFEDIKTNFSSPDVEEEIYSKFGKAGWSRYNQLNLGAVATYDTRDNTFYPLYGTFIKGTFAFSQAGWGSTYSIQEVAFDFRKYIPVFKFSEHTLALQAQFKGVFGQEIPFQLLSTLGGLDLLRGFRQSKYIDNMMMAVQIEYRLPIYKRLKAAVFCATGDVFDSNNFQWSDKIKIAYGTGLRYRINDARVHLRLDIAKNNYGDKIRFYITATEAF